MAVSKLWPVTVRLATVLDYASNPEKTTKSKSKYSDADYQALRDVVNYVKNGEKTEQEFCIILTSSAFLLRFSKRRKKTSLGGTPNTPCKKHHTFQEKG